MKVDYLKTIRVAVETGTSQDSLKQIPGSIEFIYGTGASGITPFEKGLFGKGQGDEVVIQIQKGESVEVFGHLWALLSSLIDDTRPFFFKSRIESIQTPEAREVVSALAMGNASAGCDCGCGCS